MGEREKGFSLFDPEEAELTSKGIAKAEEDTDDEPRRVLARNDEGKYRDASGAIVSTLEETDVLIQSDDTLRDISDWTLVNPDDFDMQAWGKAKPKDTKPKRTTLPSFEFFLGQTSELLYNSLHVKACFAPFLAHVVRSPSAWNTFFNLLFFDGSIPQALSQLDLSEDARPSSWVRSPVRLSESGVMSRRNDEKNVLNQLYLPINCYLKAVGSDPPRSWLAALFSKLLAKGGDAAKLAAAAKQWAIDTVEHISLDPKGHDDQENGGEWFLAWLRETHRDIYDDIDKSAPNEVLTREWMQSETEDGKRNRHQVGSIKMPSCKRAFDEVLQGLQGGKEPTRRISVLAKIFIDVWMLRIMDTAAVLRMVDIVADSPSNKVVLVCYFGSAHTQALLNFWSKQGLSSEGLSRKGYLGKPCFEEDESRKLDLPEYLDDVRALFPIAD